MKFHAGVLVALVGALFPVALATNLPAVRVAFALAICLLLPGLGWARKMHFGDLGDTIALAVVLSICTTVAVGTAMAVSDSWSLGWGLAALGGVALIGFVPVRLLIDRAGAAVRLRIAQFGDDGGAWTDWYRETQQAKARQAPRRRHRQRGLGGVGGLVRRRQASGRGGPGAGGSRQAGGGRGVDLLVPGDSSTDQARRHEELTRCG